MPTDDTTHLPVQPTSWTYSETIDEPQAVIRVRGLVDELAVDLLRGTIEELHRRGHGRITVVLTDADEVLPAASAVLAQVASALERRAARLVIR
jgi:hypothetical protein